MFNTFTIKKFYRDLSDSEKEFLDEILEDMRAAEVEVPEHVIERMRERKLILSESLLNQNLGNLVVIPGIREAIQTLDEGFVYEVSNEALGRTRNPYRIVIAREFEDGFTMFVKVSPQRDAETIKILDVWKRSGKVPIYPPPHSLKQFKADWDVVESIETFLDGMPVMEEESEAPYVNVS